MCKFIGKSNERILCKLSKIEILRLYSNLHVAMLPVNQNPLSVYFSLANFQLMSCNLALAMIWQMTYTYKLPKPYSFTCTLNRIFCIIYSISIMECNTSMYYLLYAGIGVWSLNKLSKMEKSLMNSS